MSTAFRIRENLKELLEQNVQDDDKNVSVITDTLTEANYALMNSVVNSLSERYKTKLFMVKLSNNAIKVVIVPNAIVYAGGDVVNDFISHFKEYSFNEDLEEYIKFASSMGLENKDEIRSHKRDFLKALEQINTERYLNLTFLDYALESHQYEEAEQEEDFLRHINSEDYVVPHFLRKYIH